MAASGGAGLLSFLRLMGQLKTEGALGSSKEPQKSSSIAEKAIGADMKAFLSILLQTVIATELCIRLALVHDMAECIVGDIAPADNIPKEEKHRREEAAMQQLTQLLSEDLRKEIYELWEEYENQSTAEAKFVKQLDQCEMILQAFEYEELENTPGRLQDFFDSTAGKFVHPEILQLNYRREPNEKLRDKAEHVQLSCGEAHFSSLSVKFSRQMKRKKKQMTFQTALDERNHIGEINISDHIFICFMEWLSFQQTLKKIFRRTQF
ncbi:hypothetical protein IHE44_0009428 [Lamprotornis superbus]|uniref:5'-deoxynucleotidase HDDC2 n=1 Tax=Lamprotornis superbus TaxID=245042 RepID=A0A835P359_9PASS|nr:hypothetical protein IHE44_0009428 [Lamprotornis superbus]